MKRLRLDRFGDVVFELFSTPQRMLDALDLELPSGDLARRALRPPEPWRAPGMPWFVITSEVKADAVEELRSLLNR